MGERFVDGHPADMELFAQFVFRGQSVSLFQLAVTDLTDNRVFDFLILKLSIFLYSIVKIRYTKGD